MTTDRIPALLAVVKQEPLEQAFHEFERGKPRIYFGTNSEIGTAINMAITDVYFKVTGSKPPSIRARAMLLGITTEMPPPVDRLKGRENEVWKFYYGFRDLTNLSKPVLLPVLRYYKSEKPLRNDVQGACIVEEVSHDSIAL